MTETNPFPASDTDRHAIWEMLVRRDSDFFLTSDWSFVSDDYIECGFLGIGAAKSLNPADWRPTYPTLMSYRTAAQENCWQSEDFAEPLRAAWFRCQSLSRIDIAGDIALAHKRINGSIARNSGGPLTLDWCSVFHLRRINGYWKIAGFIGYLPLQVT